MRRFVISSAVLSMSLLWMTDRATAQADPFGGDPFGSLSEPAMPAAEEAPAAARRERPAAPEETDPAVLAIRESNPQTPLELTRAVQWLLDLQRPDEAARYLARLSEADLDARTLEQLHGEFGSVFFLRLARREDLPPEASELADQVLSAAAEAVRDPARLAELIARLDDPVEATRHAAVVDLRQAGEAAVVALIDALVSDPSRQSVQRALVAMGDIATGPLMEVLSADSSPVRIAAIRTLAALDARRAIPLLLVPALVESSPENLRAAAGAALERLASGVPTRAQAEAFLQRQARRALQGETLVAAELDELETLWRWDPAAQSVASEVLPLQVIEQRRAARLAQQLVELAPGRADYRRLYLAALFQSAYGDRGLDSALPGSQGMVRQVAADAGTAAMEEVLVYALEQRLTGAALLAIELLGDSGDVHLLSSSGGRPRALAQALQHADPRVRFAAITSILRLDPQEPFAGSSYLPSDLAFFIRTTGVRRALVAHPRADQAQTLVGMLQEIGIEADWAANGAQVYQLARSAGDYEFILMSDAVDQPSVAELLQQFRRDPRTALLPIGVLARQERLQAMQRLTESDPLSETFPRPHDLEGIALTARRLLQRGESHQVPYEERVVQARTALQAFARLASQPQRYAFYDLLRYEPAVEQALLDPALSELAAEVLGYFATPSAQRTLITFASQNSRPLALRQRAAEAFARAVQQRGILLTRDEILQQYERYNASATLDRDTQRVLGSLLDALEAPTRDAVGRQSTESPVES